MGKTTTFGQRLRQLRVERRIGLRVFAEQIGMQASNLSNVECDRIPPPLDAGIIERMAAALEVSAQLTQELNDLAVATRPSAPPPDVARYTAATPGVPVLLRSMSGRSLTVEQIKELCSEIEARYPRDVD